MKAKPSTIRGALINAIFKSLVLACVCIAFLLIVMYIASYSKQFAIFFYKYLFVFIFLFLAIFSVLFIVFFILFVNRKIHYLEEITETLKRISEGDLNVNIPIKTTNELGKMAQTVNYMAVKLKASIEEERQLEQSKNNLITNISHDIRTPLTSILGYLQLIDRKDYENEEELRRYSNITYQQCKNLKILIDDLFEYSKLSNAEYKINKIKINLGELLQQKILVFIPTLKEAEMEYRSSFINEKIIIDADPLLLSRVFDNLLNNAIKYGKKGKYIDIDLDKEGSEAVVQIKNYGMTISETDIKYVFEKFYRTDKASCEDSKGSGLGLAIVKSIIELHKGTVGVSSSDNRTVFEVRLKIA